MRYDFPKWEGFSYETRENNELIEFYPTEVWDGEMSEEEFMKTFLSGKRVIKHNYRWLVYGTDEDGDLYDSGETIATCYEVSENGIITECEMWDDYWD